MPIRSPATFEASRWCASRTRWHSGHGVASVVAPASFARMRAEADNREVRFLLVSGASKPQQAVRPLYRTGLPPRIVTRRSMEVGSVGVSNVSVPGARRMRQP
ncbi:MAG TPA: hypothetical protein DHU96_05600 [Actinobacteria bacterium]|nr:hypothetical protein [Actinomycetota bacterium]